MLYLIHDEGQPYLVCACCAELFGGEPPPQSHRVFGDLDGCELCEVSWAVGGARLDAMPVAAG